MGVQRSPILRGYPGPGLPHPRPRAGLMPAVRGRELLRRPRLLGRSVPVIPARGLQAAPAPRLARSLGAGPGSPRAKQPTEPAPSPRGSSRVRLNSLRLDLAISSLNRVTIEPRWDPNKEFESS